ncbi:MAG: hypothetical protein CL843_12925 [Crocinitomicaceae bacterium]|nr:hypothetical protein [Crocinitomicaceae bacterium]|tara:strand:+ start:13867 stop:16077 length:2211 start_codon:yes stop_codon:yes gene_type:complete
MDLITLGRIILKNLKWLILFPLVTTVVVIFLTRSLPKSYTSKTVVYTGIASGYDITTGDNSRIDYFAVNNAFDNLITTIKSRETSEEVAMKLIAQHLVLDSARASVIGKEAYAIFKESFPEDFRASLTVPGDFDATFKKIKAFKNKSVKNKLEQLLASSNPLYSIKAISSGMSVKRISNSDMIEINYTSIDPGVAQHTLFFLANGFMQRFKGLKGTETSDVVSYFEKQLQEAFNKLQESEEKLKDFGVNNRIINYQEQTKYIAESREELQKELYNQRMNLEAARAAIERLETKMDDRASLLKNNKEIEQKRKQLAEINMLLTNAELYKEEEHVKDSLMRESIKIRADLRDYAERSYGFKYSVEGVKSETLLDSWLKEVISYEETSAKLIVFQERKKEFDELYDKFAPLGSTLAQLEREVGIREKQYLEVLHGLNNAQLRAQNLKMSNSLSVLDAPFFPIEAQASKRGIMVIGAFAGSLILLLVIIFAKEFLDNSIKTISRAEKLSNLALISAFPYRTPKTEKHYDFETMESSLLEQALTTLHLETQRVDPYKPTYLVNIFSLREYEGKTYFSLKLMEKLDKINGKILYLVPDNDDFDFPDSSNYENLTILPYEITPKFVRLKSWKDLVTEPRIEESLDNYSAVILELPSISQTSLPSDIVQAADFSMCLTSSKRVWTQADDHLLHLYLDSAFNKTMILLNKVHPDHLEGLLGEVPKKRSALRKTLKRIARLNFNKV